MRLTAQCNADEQRESPGRTQNRKQMFLNCSMYKNIFTVLSISPFLTRRQAEITDPSCPSQGKWFLSDNYKLASNKNGINFRQNTMINVFFPFPSGCTLEKKKKKSIRRQLPPLKYLVFWRSVAVLDKCACVQKVALKRGGGKRRKNITTEPCSSV